jgi:hypothetical protein
MDQDETNIIKDFRDVSKISEEEKSHEDNVTMSKSMNIGSIFSFFQNFIDKYDGRKT